MRSRRKIVTVAAGALLLLVGVIWWRALRAQPGTAVPDDESAASIAAAEPPPAAPHVSALPPPPRRAAARDDEVITSDGMPIMPAHDGEPKTEGMHPHPITPQHQRLFAENRLVGALEGAMLVKDAAGIRRLLEQYRREYPEDQNMLQDGYAVIADCLDHPGDASSRAEAEAWLVGHNGSPVKRFVLRHCLEPPTP
jgi:hypothetical protein